MISVEAVGVSGEPFSGQLLGPDVMNAVKTASTYLSRMADRFHIDSSAMLANAQKLGDGTRAFSSSEAGYGNKLAVTRSVKVQETAQMPGH